jgi:hypothetical protein
MKNFLYSMMLVGVTVFSFAAMLFVGCGSPDQIGQGGGGGSGVAGAVVINQDASASSRGGAGGSGTSGDPPNPDANCGSTTSSTSHEPADVLLVLDRSGSMDYSIAEDCYCTQQSGGTVCSNTSNCTTRWPSLTSAVDATLTATTGSINWGLKLYSSTGNGCTVSNGVEVAISGTSVATIQTQIGSTKPGGNTPTAQAITAATAYLKTVNDNNNHVILLATDGEPNCASGGSSTPNVQATVDAITAAKTAGFLVYVIGIGPQAALTNLQSFAVAGGTGNYYPATSPQDLATAFSSISRAVTTCTFTSPTAPPDVNNVAVYLDKNLVQKDNANGWSFGANSQTFVLNGSSCDKITSGAASNVQILFGCPGSTQPPPQNIP